MSSFTHYRVQNHQQTPILSGSKADYETFLAKLTDELTIRIISLTEEKIVFDLIGVDASIANALRRILLAEVGSACLMYIYKSFNVVIDFDVFLPIISFPGSNRCN